jgi:hypothetical protein
MSKGSKTFPIGRNSETGRLESVQQTKRHPSTSQVERMPKSGYGDTKNDTPRKGK